MPANQGAAWATDSLVVTVRGNGIDRRAVRASERAPQGRVGRAILYAGENGFEVEVPGGPTQIVVERGTEYTPLRLTLTVPWTGTVDVDAPLERACGAARSEQ